MKNLILTEKMEKQLREAIDRTGSQTESDSNSRQISRDLNILPLAFDMGGWFGLNLQGEVVSASWDDIQEIRVETDQRIINFALYQGSKRYPDIPFLVPERSENSKICPFCKGAGLDPEYSEISNIVCYCGGLSWVPNEDKIPGD